MSVVTTGVGLNRSQMRCQGTGNRDPQTIEGFGVEWARFTQEELGESERMRVWNDYFDIFPWDHLNEREAIGADVGCGSGRWASLVASRVKHLHLIDASEAALAVARKNLEGVKNISFHNASVDALPFADESLDFAYCLGVLHHVPDTMAGLMAISSKLKGGAPFLVYLYYALDGRPLWFRMLWRIVDLLRRLIARMPVRVRCFITDAIALCIYWPLARLATLLDRCGGLPVSWPLAYYRDKTFYAMRTDSLDRFGTRLEQRFSRYEVRMMLEKAGFTEIRFSEHPPYWCAVGLKARFPEGMSHRAS